MALETLDRSDMMEAADEISSCKDFTSLRCWQSCRLVRLFIYNKVIPNLPVEEKHNLNFQVRKSARSITANIAEGAGRYHYQEAIQFLRIARGSLDELFDGLIFSLK